MMSNMENLNPQVMRYIAKELKSLTLDPPEGIRVITDNDSDITDIRAVIDGPADTPYAGGKFLIKLVVGKEFPAAPPKGYFLTKIFHPNVASPSGEICVNTLKKDWKSDLGIKHILLTVKCLLIVPNPESALNEEAGKLLLERYDDYCSRAKLFTEIHAQGSNLPSSTKSVAANSSDSEGEETTSNNSRIPTSSIENVTKINNKIGESSKTISGSSSSASSSSASLSSTAAAAAASSSSSSSSSEPPAAKKALTKKEKSIKDKKAKLKRL